MSEAPSPWSFARVLVAAAATGAVLLPAAAASGPSTAQASNSTPRAGLVGLCSTDTFVRIGAVNESAKDVTIQLTETAPNGKPTSILGSNASDQLRGIFPITIPANSNYAITWSLPVPAIKGGVPRTGGDAWLHGTVGGGQFIDENGLTYQATGGTMGRNGQTCTPPATPTTPTTTTTTAPSADPVPVAPKAVYSTINSRLARNAVDGDPTTSFVTQMAEWALPTWAWWVADLGEEVPLVEIRWRLSRADTAETMRIEVSTNGRSWTTVATPDDDEADTTEQLNIDTTARLVRFTFRNTAPIAQLGHLAEVLLVAAPGFRQGDAVAGPSVGSLRSNVETTVQPTVAAERRGDRYRVQTSARSSNSPVNSSRLPLDGKSDTAWRTSMSVAPGSGWTAYDLGEPVPLGEIRWKFSEVGYADAFRVQVSDNATTWRTVATRTNATEADAWQSTEVEVTARFVRFFFYNPNQDPDLGFLSEVRFYPPA
jgi:hypothetical protein